MYFPPSKESGVVKISDDSKHFLMLAAYYSKRLSQKSTLTKRNSKLKFKWETEV